MTFQALGRSKKGLEKNWSLASSVKSSGIRDVKKKPEKVAKSSNDVDRKRQATVLSRSQIRLERRYVDLDLSPPVTDLKFFLGG